MRAECVGVGGVGRYYYASDLMEDRAFWLAVRQALLMMVDAIELRLGLPRTSALRRKVLKSPIISDILSVIE